MCVFSHNIYSLRFALDEDLFLYIYLTHGEFVKIFSSWILELPLVHDFLSMNYNLLNSCFRLITVNIKIILLFTYVMI